MIVYCAENKINGKKYVGRTIRKLYSRKAEHIRHSKNENIKYYFYQAMRKYGQQNFKWYVLEKCSDQVELIEKEDFYIKKFGDYNIGSATDGGDNITNNPRKDKIDWNSKARSISGKKRWTKEEKKKQSIIAKNQWSEAKKEKLLIGLKNKLKEPIFRQKYLEKQRSPGGAYSPEIIKKRSSSRARKWILYDPEGNRFIIKNLSKFCRENALNISTLYNSYKGWKCIHYGSKKDI